jgi:hypothetical protein
MPNSVAFEAAGLRLKGDAATASKYIPDVNRLSYALKLRGSLTGTDSVQTLHYCDGTTVEVRTVNGVPYATITAEAPGKPGDDAQRVKKLPQGVIYLWYQRTFYYPNRGPSGAVTPVTLDDYTPTTQAVIDYVLARPTEFIYPPDAYTWVLSTDPLKTFSMPQEHKLLHIQNQMVPVAGVQSGFTAADAAFTGGGWSTAHVSYRVFYNNRKQWDLYYGGVFSGSVWLTQTHESEVDPGFYSEYLGQGGGIKHITLDTGPWNTVTFQGVTVSGHSIRTPIRTLKPSQPVASYVHEHVPPAPISIIIPPGPLGKGIGPKGILGTMTVSVEEGNLVFKGLDRKNVAQTYSKNISAIGAPTYVFSAAGKAEWLAATYPIVGPTGTSVAQSHKAMLLYDDVLAADPHLTWDKP